MIIKIFGSRHEGKSTIFELIKKTLTQHGIEVSGEDEGPSPKIDFSERLQTISQPNDALKVEIKVIPYSRESKPQYAVEFEKSQNK